MQPPEAPVNGLQESSPGVEPCPSMLSSHFRSRRAVGCHFGGHQGRRADSALGDDGLPDRIDKEIPAEEVGESAEKECKVGA